MGGLSPQRSTIDRIAALKLILQRRHEFQEPFWVAYVDFHSAFDSVDRSALWLLLQSHSILQKLIDLMEDLYTNTVSCIRADGARSDWFVCSTGVR